MCTHMYIHTYIHSNYQDCSVDNVRGRGQEAAGLAGGGRRGRITQRSACRAKAAQSVDNAEGLGTQAAGLRIAIEQVPHQGKNEFTEIQHSDVIRIVCAYIYTYA